MQARLVAAGGIAAVLAGCGGTAADRTPAVDWRANATGVLEQLHADIAAAQNGGTTRAEAARSLADTSALFGLLVAYSDFGGCRTMVVHTTAPARALRALELPCGRLERAAALFTDAVSGPDPAALAQATREAAAADPQVVRALAAVRPG